MKHFLLIILSLTIFSCSKSDDDNMTSNNLPTAFMLTAPSNNATNITVNPALSWQAATDLDGDAVTYSVYLDKNANPGTLLQNGLTAISFTPATALKNNTAYYWKVVATDAKGAKTESSVFKFTTLASVPTTASLPVKVMYKNASGTIFQTSTITYDTQKRINKLVIVNQNSNLNAIQNFSYENGKIIQFIDWEDAVKPLEKYIYYYDGNGMTKEELYYNNVLAYNYEWFYRADGGKERRIKDPDAANSVVQTYFYKFSATGNIERVVWDTAGEDFEYTYSNYDNKLRSISSPVLSTVPYILLGFQGTNLFTPNNPQAYTRKSLTTGNMISSHTIEHTYNNKNQVTEMKIKDSNSGALKEIRTIEYQEF
ncbi:Ig-like domain-containing protein [Flavobacterium sp. 1355]|jgi:hypothetical protein|uniref:Ig-like domain-containing protein n=1 Tax=Flavobacterium sp. 1355 TaxID=2806571 RepID=UPI001AE12B4B|nr:Ig-like domain-containing protein [Flavobacterium sp. 1355]MBP1223067.1 hypothetical protein [Flavobacterium sp. 1355]